MGKTTWYKGWSKKTSGDGSICDSGKHQLNCGDPKAKRQKTDQKNLEVVGVILVQRTEEGRLAEAIRREEQVISKLSG